MEKDSKSSQEKIELADCWCGREGLVNCDDCGAPRCVLHAEIGGERYGETVITCWPECRSITLGPLDVIGLEGAQ